MKLLRDSFSNIQTYVCVLGESREKKSPGTTQATTPQYLEPIDQSESDAMYHAVNESESLETGDAVMVSIEEQKDVDPLDKFLPPPPKTRCSEELQVS